MELKIFLYIKKYQDGGQEVLEVLLNLNDIDKSKLTWWGKPPVKENICILKNIAYIKNIKVVGKDYGKIEKIRIGNYFLDMRLDNEGFKLEELTNELKELLK